MWHRNMYFVLFNKFYYSQQSIEKKQLERLCQLNIKIEYEEQLDGRKLMSGLFVCMFLGLCCCSCSCFWVCGDDDDDDDEEQLQHRRLQGDRGI